MTPEKNRKEEQMPSVIRSITLQQKNTYGYETIYPTLVNFFYGKNGVGKSTLTNTIKAKEGLDPVPTDYDLLVFNADFIRENIREDASIPGVFSVSKEAIEKEEEIQKKEAELAFLKNTQQELSDKLNLNTRKLEQLREDLNDICWKLTAQIRNSYKHSMNGKRRSKNQFTDELLKIRPASRQDLSKIQTVYETVYGETTTIYPLFKTVTPVSPESIPGYSLLARPILNSSDTPFARFIKTIGATDWIRQGHDRFTHISGKKCPYCSQPLPKDFESQLAGIFDEQYKQDITELKSFISAYEAAVDQLLQILENNLNNNFPKINLSTYASRLRSLSAVIEQNKKLLASKLSAPSTTVILKEINQNMQEINDLIIGYFNPIICKHNDILSSLEEKKKFCQIALWQHMASLVKDEIRSYKSEENLLQEDINSLNRELEDTTCRIVELKTEITKLTGEIVDVDFTIDHINTRLRDSGFQGFKIQKARGERNKYVIIRDNDQLAKGLSEGERNFLAFLYFYYKVCGRNPDDTDLMSKIVVIDDPISSMDSTAVFIVSSLVRDLIDNCLRNGLISKSTQSRSIKQIFILTHNAYFHKQISYDKLRYYEQVNSYLITKSNNISRILLCTRSNPASDNPALLQNYSPVQNSYAALWQEYKEVTTSVVLKRVIRQILEYYFIQICGYERKALRDRVLSKIDEILSVSEESQIAEMKKEIESLLEYIYADHIGLNDGIYYFEDPQVLPSMKEAFRKIFECMDQLQHYNMMMETTFSIQ